MKVNGFQIREAIKQWTTKRELAEKQFQDAGFYFPGEMAKDPAAIAAVVDEAGRAVATLESLQQAFNATQVVEAAGETMPLAVAVKRVSHSARLENLWKTYAGRGLTSENARTRAYGQDALVRKTDEVRPIRVVLMDVAVEQANKAAKVTGALRAGIATANGRSVEIEPNFEKLFA